MISESPDDINIKQLSQLVMVLSGRKASWYKKTTVIPPGSIMLRHDTRKYFPHAVPRSTLSTTDQEREPQSTSYYQVSNLSPHNTMPSAKQYKNSWMTFNFPKIPRHRTRSIIQCLQISEWTTRLLLEAKFYANLWCTGSHICLVSIPDTDTSLQLLTI